MSHRLLLAKPAELLLFQTGPDNRGQIRVQELGRPSTGGLIDLALSLASPDDL
jgi:hypothetical protein